MTAENLLNKIRNHPDEINFNEVIDYISEYYQYTPARFSNGGVINEAGSNEGSCKIFAFGLQEGLSEAETLTCFGSYYRDEVLSTPTADNHANIRSFMKHGWQGIHFDTKALSKKQG